MKYSLFAFNLVFLLSFYSAAKEFDTGAFSLSQLSIPPSSSLELKRGLEAYLNEGQDCQKSQSPCVSQDVISQLTEKNQKFETQFREILSSATQQTIKYQYQTKGNVMSFKFPSLIQNGNHPSNFVHGYVYFPAIPAYCDIKFPATVIAHHVGNDLSPEQNIAKAATFMGKGIVMLIYLPKYGPRRFNQESFMSSDIQEFKTNALQAILDLHAARDLLSSLNNVDQNNISLYGISLGGILTYMSAGIDPVFTRYGTLVGGADLASIIDKRKTENPKSETGKALAHIQWDKNQARIELAEIEPLVWAHRVKGKKITAFNAEEDDLIDLERGAKKILEIYRQNGNQVEFHLHNGNHRPDVKGMGILKFWKSILGPLLDFISEGSTANISSCQNQGV